MKNEVIHVVVHAAVVAQVSSAVVIQLDKLAQQCGVTIHVKAKQPRKA